MILLRSLQPVLGVLWVLLQALYAYMLTPPRVSLFVRLAQRDRRSVLRVILQSNQQADYVGVLRIVARLEAPNRFLLGAKEDSVGVVGYVGTSEDAARVAWTSVASQTEGGSVQRGLTITMASLRGMKTVVFEAPVEVEMGRASGYLEGRRRSFWEAVGLQREDSSGYAGVLDLDARFTLLHWFRIPWAVDTGAGSGRSLARALDPLRPPDYQWSPLVGTRFRYGDWRMLLVAEAIVLLTYAMLGDWLELFEQRWDPGRLASWSPVVISPVALALLVYFVFRAVRPRWAPVAQGYQEARSIRCADPPMRE